MTVEIKYDDDVELGAEAKCAACCREGSDAVVFVDGQPHGRICYPCLELAQESPAYWSRWLRAYAEQLRREAEIAERSAAFILKVTAWKIQARGYVAEPEVRGRR